MNNLTETWRTVKGYEGLYEVSSFGRMKSLPKSFGCYFRNSSKLLNGYVNKRGYDTIGLIRYGEKLKLVKIHRIVAMAFIPNPNNKPTVNHKNGIRDDNRVENLEWATVKENTQHAFRNGICNNNQFNKKVAQIKDGKVMAIWESFADASRELKIFVSAISSCCSGKYKSAGGFQWKIQD